jgi:hypothetical protein
MSYIPAVTIAAAWLSAVDALAQAFSTFTTGIFPIPRERRITWPRMHS